MKIAIVLLVGLCGLTAASLVTQKSVKKVADKMFLERQKDILRLMMHVHQPNAYQDQNEIANSWDIESNLASYTNASAVKQFIQRFRAGAVLPPQAVFTVYNRVHMGQLVNLYQVFYSAKDYETFYKTAVWARSNVNEGLFVTALSTAILHRPDTQGMILPAPYEIYPYYFINNDVIHKAQQYHMQNYAQFQDSNTVGNTNVVVIPYNYSGWYLNLNQEQQLAYLTEDIGWNAYFYYLNLDYPYWLGGEEHALNRDRRGELYLYNLQQILARYYLERLSNGLGEIPAWAVTKPMSISYMSQLHHENGLEFPMRPANVELIHDSYTATLASRMDVIERRIIEAIDTGFIQNQEGKQIHWNSQEGINILGNLIQGNPDAENPNLYGHYEVYARLLAGFAGKPLDSTKVQSSVLEHDETALRDPVFYSIYKKIVKFYTNFKLYRQSPYSRNDLLFPGVKIESVTADKLVTYFDYFDVELNNAVYTDYRNQANIETPKVLIKARQMRLNHKPYTIRINVASDKPTPAVVRIFLGPKYDENGRVIPMRENRQNFVEMDKFIYDLKSGKNVIERNSRDAFRTVNDRTSYYTLYQKVMSALQGGEQFILDNSEAHCGFPNRLLLPKGRAGGMTYQFFVVVTPLSGNRSTAQEVMITCGVGSGKRDIDNWPMGYPLDREIDPTQFYTPNMIFQDVVINHKRLEDVSH